MFDPTSLSSLPESERELWQTLSCGPSTTVPFQTIHRAFIYHAQLTPHAIAVTHPSVDFSLTYLELDSMSNRLARRLRSMGVIPGTRVVILTRRSVINIVAILSVLKAGGQYVPLDGDTIPDPTLRHVLDDSNPVVVLSMRRYLAKPAEVGDGGKWDVLGIEDVIKMDWMGGVDDSGLEELATGDDGCYVIYTSGTTGKPKGVDVTHAGICNFLLQSPGNMNMRPGLHVAQLLNIAFDMGAWETLGALSNGCTLYLRGDTSSEWRSILKSVHVVIATPSVLAPHNPLDYPNITDVVTGGEVCPQDLADRWSLCTRFYNCCGPTEISIANTISLHITGRPISIGIPVPNTNVYILDENMRPCRLGETGRMWVGGKGVSRGYLNLEELTGRVFRRDVFAYEGEGSGKGKGRMFNTGDLCRWREDGLLDHLGRADDQVKVKGFRVELDGISSALISCHGIQRATTLLIADELWAFLTPSNISIAAINLDVSLHLPYYAVPRRYLPLDAFPLTSNGKVDKRVLRRLAEEEVESGRNDVWGMASPHATPKKGYLSMSRQSSVSVMTPTVSRHSSMSVSTHSSMSV